LIKSDSKDIYNVTKAFNLIIHTLLSKATCKGGETIEEVKPTISNKCFDPSQSSTVHTTRFVILFKLIYRIIRFTIVVLLCWVLMKKMRLQGFL